MATRRVLLAIPIPTEEGGGLRLRHDYYPPHPGLAAIAGYLCDRDIEVRIFDGWLDPSADDFRAVIRDFRPGIVGITAFTRDIVDAGAMAGIVKALEPGITTVIGGFHATALPVQTLREFPAFDVAVAGEGEKALLEIALSDGDGVAIRRVAGTASRVDGQVVAAPPRMETLDLNEAPVPRWDLFDLPRYSGLSYGYKTRVRCDREFSVELARGCPGRCTFCSHVVPFDKCKVKAVPTVIREIEGLVAGFEAQRIVFYSDTITITRHYTAELCEALIDSGLHRRISWGCLARADLLDPDLAAVMGRAGCRFVSLGLESGSPRILKSVNKLYDYGKAAENIRALRAAGIWTVSNFILGFPDETRDEIQATIDLAMGLDLDGASFGILVPYPGAPITRELQASGQLASLDWSRYGSHVGADLIRRKHLSPRELLLWTQWANLRFWARPGRIREALRLIDLRSVATHFIQVARSLVSGRR
jgi:radical SAM superfamily enzyme YgiQ (UPF0313 family)